MATQFTSETTSEWAFTRWFGGRDRGACFDFGARHGAAFEVFEAAARGETFVGETGERFGADELARAAETNEFTFGEFGGTFESGSADEFRFHGF